MTLNEAAALLGVTAATLRQQIANGRLKAKKMGRDWYVTSREVNRYDQQRRRQPTISELREMACAGCSHSGHDHDGLETIGDCALCDCPQFVP